MISFTDVYLLHLDDRNLYKNYAISEYVKYVVSYF